MINTLRKEFICEINLDGTAFKNCNSDREIVRLELLTDIEKEETNNIFEELINDLLIFHENDMKYVQVKIKRADEEIKLMEKNPKSLTPGEDKRKRELIKTKILNIHGFQENSEDDILDARLGDRD